MGVTVLDLARSPGFGRAGRRWLNPPSETRSRRRFHAATDAAAATNHSPDSARRALDAAVGGGCIEAPSRHADFTSACLRRRQAT